LNVVAGPLVLRATPQALVGRVVAVLQPLISLAAMLSMAAAGWLAGGLLSGFHARWLGVRWGTVDTIFTGAGVLIVAGGLYAAVRLSGLATATNGTIQDA